MSWTVEELQRYMNEHIASKEKFKLAPNAMQNIPENLREDLFSRMEYLLEGICGDMQEGEYAHMKRYALGDISLSEELLETLDKYHFRMYNKMSRTVLECANNEYANWRELVKILFASEKYFRKHLSSTQLKEYEQTVATWKHEFSLYMHNEIYESYRLLLK